MATLLLHLRDVPDDEAEEIRALLDAHAIDWYETQPSRWGVSAGAIWARHADQAESAREQLAIYQQQRAARAREQRAIDLREGRVDTVWMRIRQQPLRMLAVVAGIVLVLLLGLLMLPVMLLR